MRLAYGFGQGQVTWVATSRCYLTVQAGDVLLSAIIWHDCESQYDGASGRLPECQPDPVEPARLTGAMEALFEGAMRVGLIGR